MGCFTTTCMASGLPITWKQKAVVLFTTPNHDGVNRGGCYVHDAHEFISFPIFITMDEYGGSSYFSDDQDCPKEKAELEKQAAWKVFSSCLKTVRDKKRQGGGPYDHDDWMRNLIYKDSGIWESPFHNGSKFDDGIIWTAKACYRRDIWDMMIKSAKKRSAKYAKKYPEFNKPEESFVNRLREQCKPIPDGLPDGKERDLALMRKCAGISRCDFLHHSIQRILTSGGCKEKWNGKLEIDLTLTPEETEELISLTDDMNYFCGEMDRMGRHITPGFNMAPQCGFSGEPDYSKDLKNFHKACIEIIDRESGRDE